MQRKRDLFHTTASVRKNALSLFAADCAEYAEQNLTEPVLMSFVSDPYQPDELELRITRKALEIAAAHKVSIHILTKGGTRAIPDFPILAETGPQSAYACTLTVYDKLWAAKLEPGAAEPADRLQSLKSAHDAGLSTWVSFEPSIDEQSVIRFIQLSHSYVDLYKVGSISGDKSLSRISNWRDYGLNVINELEKYEKKYIIKNDLKKELIPDGNAQDNRHCYKSCEMKKNTDNQSTLFPEYEARPYKEPVLISACFLGIPTRWHGRRAKKRDALIEKLKEKYILVPVCPEQLGGMPTPRTGEYLNGTGAQVLDEGLRIIAPENGADVTAFHVRGAEYTLEIAKIVGAERAYLKSGSPSCDREGVAGEVLKRGGVKVIKVG